MINLINSIISSVILFGLLEYSYTTVNIDTNINIEYINYCLSRNE